MEFNEDKSLHASSLFDKYAKEYQDKFMDVSLYGDSLNLFCDLIPGNQATILDLACGPGNITKYLLTQKPGLVIRGIDLAPNMVMLAQQNNPGANFEIMDCRSIGNIAENFDGVIGAFCLPYLSKQEANKLMKDICQLLNEEGILYLSTMEDDHKKSGYEVSSKGDKIFMHYYEGEYLVNELERQNFQVIETFRKKSIMTNGREVVDLAIIARKKIS